MEVSEAEIRQAQNLAARFRKVDGVERALPEIDLGPCYHDTDPELR
jgi:hypothetical protein